MSQLPVLPKHKHIPLPSNMCRDCFAGILAHPTKVTFNVRQPTMMACVVCRTGPAELRLISVGS